MTGIGGQIKAEPSHFIVSERPATEPVGEGDHLWIEVEKVNLSTPGLINALSRRLGLKSREFGVAGRKDKRAITRQWLSLPAGGPVDLPRLGETQAEREGTWTLLQSHRHGRRLRTGHLLGNRFELIVSGVETEALARAEELNRALRETGWMPNPYGPQRFSRPESIDRARQLLARAQRARDHKSRFDLSVLQSLFFNHYLRLRDWPNPLLLSGEWFQTQRGGLFTDEDEASLTARLARFEIRPCGPLPGGKLRKPGLPTQRLMAEVDSLLGTESACWRALGKRMPGAWRPLVIPAPIVDLDPVDAGLKLSFQLPAGSYATVLLHYFQQGRWEIPCID